MRSCGLANTDGRLRSFNEVGASAASLRVRFRRDHTAPIRMVSGSLINRCRFQMMRPIYISLFKMPLPRLALLFDGRSDHHVPGQDYRQEFFSFGRSACMPVIFSENTCSQPAALTSTTWALRFWPSVETRA